jgi:hypothetical protein
MFRHSETLTLFGLTAFQCVLVAKWLNESFAMGVITALLAGIVIAFFASCVEMTLLAKLLNRNER